MNGKHGNIFAYLLLTTQHRSDKNVIFLLGEAGVNFGTSLGKPSYSATVIGTPVEMYSDRLRV